MCAGDTSAIYIGPTTEDAPTAMPPMKRNKMNSSHVYVVAQPMADKRYNRAITVSVFLRPNFWAGTLVIIEPITVPIRLEATVKPCRNGLRDHNCCTVFSAPEITAVSNPKRNPPSAAIRDMRTGYAVDLVNVWV